MISLREVFLVELSDLLDAEEQLLRELPLMAARATSSELRALLDEHYRATQLHVRRLQLLFERVDERRRSALCHGMRGLIQEARERHGSWDRGPALDVAMLGAAERIEHYEIAAYGCARRYAIALRDLDAAESLQETSDEEVAAEKCVRSLLDRMLTTETPTTGREPTRASTALMPGVWVTETAGFASVPPRAESDLRPVLEQEAMVGKGEDSGRHDGRDR